MGVYHMTHIDSIYDRYYKCVYEIKIKYKNKKNIKTKI